MKNIIGIVLAGGQSKRFGEPKALAKRNGKPFLMISVDALKEVADEIVAVIRPEIKTGLPELQNIPYTYDLKIYKGHGPLAGIYTVMSQYNSEWYLVAPCDTPFIKAAVFQKLAGYLNTPYEAVVPIVNGKTEPLAAAYHQKTKKVIKSLLEQKKLSVKELLGQIKVKYVKFDEEKLFLNINTKEDYETFSQ